MMMAKKRKKAKATAKNGRRSKQTEAELKAAEFVRVVHMLTDDGGMEKEDAIEVAAQLVGLPVAHKGH
ncbi:MAG: hypothetical protein WC050_00900 [Candidatus Paceibacterota bacterium]